LVVDDGALAPFFALGFFGFFLCSVIGGEYDDTALAVWANATELPDVNRTAAATATTGVSFFMRLSPGLLKLRDRRHDGHSQRQVYVKQ
jgi:hypothetical protein